MTIASQPPAERLTPSSLPPEAPEGFGQVASSSTETGVTGVFAGAPFSAVVFWLNVLVYAGEVLVSRSTRALFPAVPSEVALAFGANYATATLYEGRVETLLASCFVHFSLLHVVVNMYALRQSGPSLERAVGTGRMATLYLASGVVGSMVSALFGWASAGQRLSAGASGALCGLIGAALVITWRVHGLTPASKQAMSRSAGGLMMLLLVGWAAGFDNAAHAGGAVAGALVAVVWERGPEDAAARTIALVGAVLLMVGATVAVLWHDLRDPFATLDANARLEFAEQALRSGRCDDARRGALAARRVAPRAPEVASAMRTVNAYCGRREEQP